MLSVALRTLRTRWVTFVGSFVALSLGVALLAVMGLALASSTDAPERRPERFAAAPVVVKGADTLRVPTSTGDEVRELAHPRAVPAELVARLRTLGTVVEDRSFAVRARGGPGDLVGHPWSTAAFAPYELDAGRAPRAADEVVVSGDWARPGERVRTDRGAVRVVGTATARTAAVASVFYTDRRAAQLSPMSVQLVVDADAAAVRAVVRGHDGVQVLTGDARRLADADPDRDSEALTAMNALFGTAGGVTAFVSVFVVASTFAFAVAQRRREFGLLRTAGATPGQIRRMVTAEALVVGVLASAAGCVLGAYGAPRLAEWVVDGGLAPDWFTIGAYTWPYHMAFWTGLFVALCGVVAASWRAGRTGPAQALREASVDTRAMTAGRWVCGVALLLTAAVTLGVALVADPGDLLHRKTYVSRPMLLITAVALLAPVLVRPLTRLIAWLPAQLPGAGGMLVREIAATGVRRTAAVAAPVLVTVALAGSLLGATATLNEAAATETRERTAADFVVVPAGDAGFDAATLRKLRDVPGAEVSATSSSAVHVLEDGVALVKSEARAADPGPLAATTRLPLAAGKVTGLDDDSIIVNEEWQRHTVGQRVDVWLGDGTKKSLRIAAVMTTGTGDNGVYVTPRNAPGAVVDRVDVALADRSHEADETNRADRASRTGRAAGADAAAVASGLREAVRASGGQVLTKDEWVRASHPETNRPTRLGLLLVLGIALLYTGIALANTMVMATSDQVRDLAVLRLAGATRWQVLRCVGAQALLVVTVGGVLGLLAAGLNLTGMWGALRLLSVRTTIEIPWTTLGATVGACAVLALVSSVAPAALALRRRAVELAGVRE
ncbi:FtsX-like permease family protein [Streptomyces sporangiiformans]|uniref:ABC transporter permease n=1 Tax=Streptomyces sporangiiformans TaxID=2315329 RepID=A0A505D7E0_9ACTN|nr:FtsX-like permease family protein [Streptomyces sporangiiformans]TPQ18222.1 ABC transporter permease [Streptomyces sporangiiformans]